MSLITINIENLDQFEIDFSKLSQKTKEDFCKKIINLTYPDNSFSVSKNTIKEIERRMENLERHPETAITWEEVENNLISKYELSEEQKQLMRVRRSKVDFSKGIPLEKLRENHKNNK